jgi:small-conductance mechanosensitive channel
MLSDLIHLLPKIIIAMMVLLIGWLLAKLVEKLISKVILYLDKLINKNLKFRIGVVDVRSTSKFISRAFFWFIIILAIGIFTRVLGFGILSTWIEGLVQYLPNILAAVIIVFIGLITGSFLYSITLSITNRTGITNGRLIGRVVRFSILFISIIIAIDQIGINIEFLTYLIYIFLAISLFGAALAFGIGAKTSVSNILGAYYIHQNFEEGNNIKIGDISGEIVKISTASVILKTENGIAVIPAKDFNEEKTTIIHKN